jgi:hypothetical protein
LMAAAISGSASASPAVKNEFGVEAVLALVEELMGQISPPPQPVRGVAVGPLWRSKGCLRRYHIARPRPSACGSPLVFMPDMVGIAKKSRPASLFPGFADDGHGPAFPRHECPGFRPKSSSEEAGNAGRRLHPQLRVQKVESTQISPPQVHRNLRHSLRDGVTVSFVLSPAIGLCCRRHPWEASAS